MKLTKPTPPVKKINIIKIALPVRVIRIIFFLKALIKTTPLKNLIILNVISVNQYFYLVKVLMIKNLIIIIGNIGIKKINLYLNQRHQIKSM